MSVRQALLALLDQEPKYGYQLRVEFEERTGSTWPLNVGQVYTTLGRLERDALVEGAGGDDEGHVMYQITPAGRAEVDSWFTTPVPRSRPPRDELAIKLALAVTVAGVDVSAVIQRQRSATIAALQDYTRLKHRGFETADTAAADRPASRRHRDELAWSLVLDSLIFAAEAEVRWLDHSESKLRRAAADRIATGPNPARPDSTTGSPVSETNVSEPAKGSR